MKINSSSKDTKYSASRSMIIVPVNAYRKHLNAQKLKSSGRVSVVVSVLIVMMPKRVAKVAATNYGTSMNADANAPQFHYAQLALFLIIILAGAYYYYIYILNLMMIFIKEGVKTFSTQEFILNENLSFNFLLNAI